MLMTAAWNLRRFLGAAGLLALLCGPVAAQNAPETFVPPPSPAPASDQPPPPLPPPAADSAPPAPPVSPGPRSVDPGAFLDPLASGRGGGIGSFFNPSMGNVPFRADYKAAWFFGEPVLNQPTSLRYLQQDFGLSLPVDQDCRNEWSGSVHLRAESFFTDAILPNTDQRFPAELWDIRFGTSYRHLFDNGWIGGGSVSLGSASDKPFHSIDEMTVAVSAFLRVPQGERNAWLFTLNLSTNSEVLPYIPIPGVAYFYNPSDYFQATIGFPFASAVIRPTDDLTVQLSYALLTTFHTKVLYRIAPPLRAYVGYDTNTENYFLAHRPDVQDRFFYYDQQVDGGVLWTLSRNASVDLSGGYVFDRFYFEGARFNDRSFNRVDVGAGPFVALQVKVRF